MVYYYVNDFRLGMRQSEQHFIAGKGGQSSN